ncbi:SUMF1/EgtB/PvdO family nonheme iron enzyme [Planctomycetota bacterium]|nr:SUMF1/EgtB/PvdO family nonheme iron enzyme [Planctomycetota bacterium]
MSGALEDLGSWRAADEAAQDAAIEAVVEQLAGFSWVRTAEYACGGQSHRIATVRHNSTGIELQLLPGGSYERGAEEDREYAATSHATEETEDFTDSRALLASETVRPFLIGRLLLSERQWATLVELQGPPPGDTKAKVGWQEATKLLARAGFRFRIPTDAEWEYACRSGTTTRNYWGDETVDPIPPTNAFGVSHMQGRPWEWVSDPYEISYRSKPDGERCGWNYRVMRGGAGNGATRGFSATAFSLFVLDGGATYDHDCHGVRVAVSIVRAYDRTRSFALGDRVAHKTFGEGAVVKVLEKHVHVRFDSDGDLRTLAVGR